MLVSADSIVNVDGSVIPAGAYANLYGLEPNFETYSEVVFEGGIKVKLPAAAAEKYKIDDELSACFGHGSIQMKPEMARVMSLYVWFGVHANTAERILLSKHLFKEEQLEILKDDIQKLSGIIPVPTETKDAWIVPVDSLKESFDESGARPLKVPWLVFTWTLDSLSYFLKLMFIVGHHSMRGMEIELRAAPSSVADEFLEKLQLLLWTRLGIWTKRSRQLLIIPLEGVALLKYYAGMGKYVPAEKTKIKVSGVLHYQSAVTFYDIPASCVNGIQLK